MTKQKYITRRRKVKVYTLQVFNVVSQQVEELKLNIPYDTAAKKIEKYLLDGVRENYPDCRLLDIVGYITVEERYRYPEKDFINIAEKY